MEEDSKSSSSCRDCCERVAWTSIVAATLCAFGVALVVAFISLSKSPAETLFAETYIAESVSTWFSWLEIGGYVGLVLMVGLILLLVSMGCMATGYQNASSWCSFKKAKTGRRQLTAFMIMTYVFNLGWYVILIGSTLPTIFFYMLNNGICNNTKFTTSTCLDLRQFGLAPQCLPGCSSSNQTTHLICGTDLVALCDSNLLFYFFLTLIGSVLVLIGMNHFLMSLSGNYNWLRIRKRRQKLQAGKSIRRSGHYDVTDDVHDMFSSNTERQLSEDSNAHLRRVNFHSGSSSNVLSSSSDSIPTVAARVSPTTLTFAIPPATTAASSSWTRRSPVDVTSTTSSQQSTKIYNQTYGMQHYAIGQPKQQEQQQQQQQQQLTRSSRPRVSFANTHTTGTATPTWSSDSAATRSSTSAPATRSSTSAPATRSSATAIQNNLSTDGEQGEGKSYDHFNPAFDENYWDHRYTVKATQHQSPNDNYYSRGYKNNAQTAQSNSVAARSYNSGGGDDGGNYNQGYYNYDYDVADGSAGFEMKPKSSYGQDSSLQKSRKPIGHNFFEYQL